MDFELTKEQEMFRDMAKEFAEREVAPSTQERDREERFFPEIMQKMADQGFFAIKVPQEMGGLGLDWTTIALVAEQLAAVDFSVSYEGCLECGSCRIACDKGAIKWVNPRGGFGISYQFG